MVDRTIYVDAATTPELSLRQIFVRHRVPAAVCLLFANNGLLTIDSCSVLGDSQETVRTTVRQLIAEADLGADVPARTRTLLCFCSVWQSASALTSHISTRRA